jgi:serine acetyltransferase
VCEIFCFYICTMSNSLSISLSMRGKKKSDWIYWILLDYNSSSLTSHHSSLQTPEHGFPAIYVFAHDWCEVNFYVFIHFQCKIQMCFILNHDMCEVKFVVSSF